MFTQGHTSDTPLEPQLQNSFFHPLCPMAFSAWPTLKVGKGDFCIIHQAIQTDMTLLDLSCQCWFCDLLI